MLCGSPARGPKVRLAAPSRCESDRLILFQSLTLADQVKLRAWATANGLTTHELQIGGFNVSSDEAHANVDFIDRSNPEWGNLGTLYEAAIGAAIRAGTRLNVGGRLLSVVPAEHLLVMKLAAGRQKDEDDVKALLETTTLQIEVVRQLIRAHCGPAIVSRFEELLQRTGHRQAKPKYRNS